MIAKLCGYILTLVSAGMLVAMAQSLLTMPKLKKIAALSGGAILTLTVLSPLTEPNWDAISWQNWAVDTSEITQMKEASEKQISDIIKRTTEAYILDKAEQIGATIRVQVGIRMENGYSVPDSVTIFGIVSDAQKSALTAYLRDELGIDEQRQVWKTI